MVTVLNGLSHLKVEVVVQIVFFIEDWKRKLKSRDKGCQGRGVAQW